MLSEGLGRVAVRLPTLLFGLETKLPGAWGSLTDGYGSQRVMVFPWRRRSMPLAALGGFWAAAWAPTGDGVPMATQKYVPGGAWRLLGGSMGVLGRSSCWPVDGKGKLSPIWFILDFSLPNRSEA